MINITQTMIVYECANRIIWGDQMPNAEHLQWDNRDKPRPNRKERRKAQALAKQK